MTSTPGINSRFLLAEEIETEEGAVTWVPPEPVPALGLADDIPYQANADDNYFRLASRNYRSQRPGARLWWAIADYQQGYKHPLAPLKVGDQLTLPSPRTVEEIILSEDRLETPPQVLAALRFDEEDTL